MALTLPLSHATLPEEVHAQQQVTEWCHAAFPSLHPQSVTKSPKATTDLPSLSSISTWFLKTSRDEAINPVTIHRDPLEDHKAEKLFPLSLLIP